jgi:hypothetical protein
MKISKINKEIKNMKQIQIEIEIKMSMNNLKDSKVHLYI